MSLLPKTSPQSDPVGAAMLAYLSGDSEAIIQVESSLTEGEEIPVWYLFRTENQIPELEKNAHTHCKGKILDLGAGAGSHSLFLQEKGFEVTAIDLSQVAVDVMKTRGVMDARQGDFFELSGNEKFDTLLMLMNGIGMVGTLEKLEHFLQFVPKLLTPDGQILLESSDILYMYEEEDGSVWIDLNDKYHGELTYTMTFGEVAGEPFEWLYIDYDLLESFAEKAGLKCEKLYVGEDHNYLARIFL